MHAKTRPISLYSSKQQAHDLPFDDKLVDTTFQVGETEALCDCKMKDGAVDGRLSEEVLTETDDRTDAEVLGDLPDAADSVASNLQLAGVDESQDGDDGDRRVQRQVDRDHFTRRELAELLNEILAVRCQHYLIAHTTTGISYI